ncbi:MAG TPA: CDP-diacylglycerol--glycerol-3-phosphate 3-phosphatidyltransferase [Candidatus Latescibacteria bacterium]|nr:CDP-diacylglycerol--glycerol-3-phosphate 3-phosphatidyltransferase [Candidatus Latescibacterota bacterium]|tara:strand:- start:1543 stop:2142 length:600 start_codon:yes stop_codon:yes gene_type:complete
MTESTGRRTIVNLPNILTVSRIFATPLFLLMLFAEAGHWRGGAVIVFLLASLTDLYDGKLARARDCVTEFGRFMDPFADKILVSSALVAFAVRGVVNAWIVVPIVVRDVAITGMRMYGLYQGRMMETSRLAKWKTTVQLVTVIVILLLLGLQEIAGYQQWTSVLTAKAWLPLLSNSLMAGVLLLTLMSGFHYFFKTGSE